MGPEPSYASRTDTTDEERSTENLVLSVNFFGAIVGAIGILLFLGGFVSGSLFPFGGLGDQGRITLSGFYELAENLGDWAKLGVWSFIFGFSERLIPNLLQNFATQIESKPSDRPAETVVVQRVDAVLVSEEHKPDDHNPGSGKQQQA